MTETCSPSKALACELGGGDDDGVEVATGLITEER